MLTICLISGSILTGVHPSPLNKSNTEIVEIDKSKTELKNEAKIERKTKRLEKKLQKINKEDKKMSKGGKLLLIGALLLIIGIVVLAGLPAATTLGGCYSAFLGLVFGIALGVGGVITMIIGLVEGV